MATELSAPTLPLDTYEQVYAAIKRIVEENPCPVSIVCRPPWWPHDRAYLIIDSMDGLDPLRPSP